MMRPWLIPAGIVAAFVLVVGGGTWAAFLVAERSPLAAALLLGTPIVLMRAFAARRLKS